MNIRLNDIIDWYVKNGEEEHVLKAITCEVIDSPLLAKAIFEYVINNLDNNLLRKEIKERTSKFEIFFGDMFYMKTSSNYFRQFKGKYISEGYFLHFFYIFPIVSSEIISLDEVKSIYLETGFSENNFNIYIKNPYIKYTERRTVIPIEENSAIYMDQLMTNENYIEYALNKRKSNNFTDHLIYCKQLLEIINHIGYLASYTSCFKEDKEWM